MKSILIWYSASGFSKIKGIAGWCNGSTADSGSVNWGSNPCPAARLDTKRP